MQSSVFLFLSNALVCLGVFLHGVAAQSEQCNLRSGSTCICDMSDGSGVVDLTPISSKSGTAFFNKIQGGGAEYSYNPCVSFVDNKCTEDVAVCQGDDGGIICGKQSTAAFAYISDTPFTLTLTYTGGQPDYLNLQKHPNNSASLADTDRSSIITLICDPAEHDFSFAGENPRLTYKFTLKTKYACPTRETTTSTPGTKRPPKPEKNHIHVGTILDIVFLVAVVLYFVIGILVMRFYRHASGIELIPNLEFWKSLPGLIKDGFFFTLSPCRRGKEGYSSM